jgi:hypothetical protein
MPSVSEEREKNKTAAMAQRKWKVGDRVSITGGKYACRRGAVVKLMPTFLLVRHDHTALERRSVRKFCKLERTAPPAAAEPSSSSSESSEASSVAFGTCIECSGRGPMGNYSFDCENNMIYDGEGGVASSSESDGVARGTLVRAGPPSRCSVRELVSATAVVAAEGSGSDVEQMIALFANVARTTRRDEARRV